MTWNQPVFTEIKMDAEFTAYCEDVDPEPIGDVQADELPCDSES